MKAGGGMPVVFSSGAVPVSGGGVGGRGSPRASSANDVKSKCHHNIVLTSDNHSGIRKLHYSESSQSF